MGRYSNVICHYASEYYDPEKAHEYYEEHKKLKGRGTLNDEGQAAKSTVTTAINNERDSKKQQSAESYAAQIKANTEALAQRTQTKREELSNKLKEHTQKMQTEIDQISSIMKNMSPAELKVQGSYFKAKIDKIRNENSDARDSLKNEYNKAITEDKNKTTSENSDLKSSKSAEAKSIIEEYKQKLSDELSKIYDDTSMVKQKTTKSSSSSKSSKSSESQSSTPQAKFTLSKTTFERAKEKGTKIKK